MKIIIGLGNIGAKYLNTRHNCGFLAIDALAEELVKKGAEVRFEEEKKLKSAIAKIIYKDETILLVKPLTFMNLSGEAVTAILSFYKAPLENLAVIYDDIDLPLGKVRIREKGSAGTHNGMRDILEKLGTENFQRIRIGIESRGESAPEQQDLHSFVLSNFTDEEKQKLDAALSEVVDFFISA